MLATSQLLKDEYDITMRFNIWQTNSFILSTYWKFIENAPMETDLKYDKGYELQLILMERYFSNIIL